MNISPVSYNANNNKNKNLSFQMKMTPDTLEILEKAGLKQTKMVQDLLNHKGSDVFTAKIVQKGKEFIFGLQHEKYNEAREIFPRGWLNTNNPYYEKYAKLDEYPHVNLYEHTPSEKTITRGGGALIKSDVYKEIKYTLSNVIENVHHEIFNGEKFKSFVNDILQPRHDKNIKLVNAVHERYQEINELIKKGQESGRLDEKATTAIQETVDKAYNGGKLSQCWAPRQGNEMTLENELIMGKCHKIKTEELVNSPKYDNKVITVKEKPSIFSGEPNDKFLHSCDPQHPKALKYIGEVKHYLENRYLGI